MDTLFDELRLQDRAIAHRVRGSADRAAEHRRAFEKRLNAVPHDFTAQDEEVYRVVKFSTTKLDVERAFPDRSRGIGCRQAKLVYPGMRKRTEVGLLQRLIRSRKKNLPPLVAKFHRPLGTGTMLAMSRFSNIIVVLFVALLTPALASSATTKLSENSRLEFFVANAGHQPGHALVSSETLLGSSEPLRLTTSVCSVAPSNVARAGMPNWASQGLDDLAAFRQKLGPVPGGGQVDGGVIARLDVGGKSFYGVNAHGQPVTMRVNAITATHAEMDAFQQAANAGARGGTARLFVDSELCGACGVNGGVRSLARQLGLKQIEIVTPSGVTTITP